MTKPTVIVTRPLQWKKIESDKLKVVPVSISADKPTRLRNGEICADSVGGIMTPEGVTNLVRAFRKHRPQAFLFWCHYDTSDSKTRLEGVVHVLGRLKEACPKCFFFYGNGNQQGFPDFNVEAYKPFIDGILVNTRDPREYRMYGSHGFKFVDTLHTFGFDPKEHGAFKGEAKYDCFFGGSQTFNMKTGAPSRFYPKNPMLDGRYPQSGERLDFLTAVNDNFRLMVCGKGKWPFKVYPYRYGREYYKVFGNARITLGMYHWPDLVRYYTKRTIYSLASGRMLITKYIRGMENDFVKGKHCDWFGDIDQGLSLIRHYLANDEKRKRIGEAGRRMAIAKHSWRARLGEFEEIVGKVLG